MAGASQVKAGEAFVKLTVQGQGSFAAAMAAARANTTSLGASITQINATPAEKYALAIQKASAALKAGTISQRTYNREIARQKGLYKEAMAAASKAKSPKMQIPTFGAIRGIAVQFAVAAAPVALLLRQIFKVNDELSNIPTNVIYTLKEEFNGLAETIGTLFGPEIKEFSQQLRGFMQTLGDAAWAASIWADSHRDAIAQIGAIVGVVSVVGGSLITLAGAIGLVKVAMIPVVITAKLMAAAFGFVVSPIGLIVAAIGGAIAAFVAFTDAGRNMATEVMGYFDWLLRGITDVISSMKDALVGGDWETAGKIAYLGIQAGFIEPLRAAWEASIAWLKETWAGFTSVLVGAFVSAAEAVINAWEKATTFVSTKVLDLIGQSSLLSKAFEKVTGATVEDTKAGVQQAAKDDLAGIRKALADVRKAEEGGLAAAVADRTATADAAAARAADLQAELERLGEKARVSREERTGKLVETHGKLKAAGTFSGFRLESQFGVDPAFALAQQQLATERQALAVGREQLRAANEIVGAVKGIKFAWGS